MKKKLIITFSVIAVLIVAGYFGYRFAVNYIFDEYVMKTALTALSNAEKNKQPGEQKEDAEGDEIEVQAILDGLKGKNEEKYTGEKKEESGEVLKSEAKKNGETKKEADKKDSEKGQKESADSKKNSQGSGGKTQSQTEKSAKSSGSTLSDSEILSRVMSDADLAYKLASMVSYEDKQAVISMVKSNFTSKQIADMLASGMSRSEMISVARNSIMGAQWSQCMAIARKYVDQIRPYVE